MATGAASRSEQVLGGGGAFGVVPATTTGGGFCPMSGKSLSTSRLAIAGGGGAAGPPPESARGVGRIAAPTAVLTVFASNQAATASSSRLATQPYFLRNTSSIVGQ